MMSSKDTVATVAEALCKKLELKPGDRAFVMVNGCGATTMMEMLVLFKGHCGEGRRPGASRSLPAWWARSSPFRKPGASS